MTITAKILKYMVFSVLITFLSEACQQPGRLVSLEPAGYDEFENITIKEGELKALFIDNSAMDPLHRAGYNGIAELYHTVQDSSVFVPTVSGFNLEHIFSGDSLEQFFEPRTNPMKLYKKSETEVLLYQPVTPVSGVESLTEFKVVEPYYIDITFSCILHDERYFRHGYAGFFWASYINSPPDRNIYFPGVARGRPDVHWISAFSEKHGVESTHIGMDDNYDLFFAPDFRIVLAKNFSDYLYSSPYYFGRFHNMALAFFFESSEVIRLTQSPTGGGPANPAWDFQYIIPDPEKGKRYSFRARMVYKPFFDNDDISAEYEQWIEQVR